MTPPSIVAPLAQTEFAANDAAAIAHIRDGATIAVSGSGGGLVEPDAVMALIEQSFLETGHPRDLTIVHALGIGDGQRRGLQRFAHEGMVKRVIGGHWSWAPGLQRLARENKIEAYTLPAGIISTLFREIGAGRPGVITKVGLGTFADPEHGGGKCNSAATQDVVERLSIGGEDFLFYRAFPIDIGLICGSAADPRNNITFMHEPADIDAYAVALAAHNSGGRVFAQVRERLPARIVPARLARIPGILVDHVLLAPEHPQCRATRYDPAISGELAGADAMATTLPSGIRRIIAERAAREIGSARSVNFGFGIPGGIPGVLANRGDLTYWGSVEQGIHNGTMLDGEMFGAARYPDAIVSSLDQFDFYGGGGVDVAFLGMGEMDAAGNVNVSKIGPDIVGPGGFVDITQPAKKVVFCGTFEAKGLEVHAGADGNVTITRHGQVPKLVHRVAHITFSGREALKRGQHVLYVTERAVFQLTAHGVELIEIAPGIDLHRDVLERMQFAPLLRLSRN